MDEERFFFLGGGAPRARNTEDEFREVGRGRIPGVPVGPAKTHGLYPEPSEDQSKEGCDVVRVAL